MLGQSIELDVLLHRTLREQELENRAACVAIGRWDEKHSIEASGTPKCRIDRPRHVRRSQNQYAAIVLREAVHLGEKLTHHFGRSRFARVLALAGQRLELV